jgi:small subunit ribosomal protein S6e
MVFKINIGEKGKSWKIESDSESLVGKKIGDKLEGSELSPELSGYELEITGTSDKSGFAGMKELEGTTLKGVLLGYGFGMHKKPKGLKKKKPNKKPHGLRLKKTVRGNTITRDVVLINLKVMKAGTKKLVEVFPDQNKPKEAVKPAEAPAPAA